MLYMRMYIVRMYTYGNKNSDAQSPQFSFKNYKRKEPTNTWALRKRLFLVACTMKFWKSTNKDEIQFDFEDKILGNNNDSLTQSRT